MIINDIDKEILKNKNKKSPEIKQLKIKYGKVLVRLYQEKNENNYKFMLWLLNWLILLKLLEINWLILLKL